MTKSVQLSNGRQWRSRKDAKAHFREMLHRYKDGEKVTDPSDESDLRALVDLYDSVMPAGKPTKTGTGIKGFSRQVNSGPGFSTPGFHVHRTDESSIDFSIYDAVESDPPKV